MSKNNTLHLQVFKDRDINNIIPDKVKLNKYLLQRYTTFGRETAIAKTESFKKYNRSAIYILPLIDLEIDSFEGKLLNTYLNQEDYTLYVQTATKVTYPLDNPYYITFIYINSFYYYIFDVSKFQKEVDLYLDSKVDDFSKEAINKITLSNWLCFMDSKISADNRNYIFSIETYLIEPRLYGFKLINSLYKHDVGGKPNPLLTYYKEVLDIVIKPGVSLMNKVDLEKELINLD